MKVFKMISGETQDLSRDEQFLKELEEVIESNLGDESFRIKDLSEAMMTSRMMIYRRLKRLTGKSINQCILEYRLERAKELLQKDVAGVSEIAYQVGFNSPSYFNKCFRKFYGCTPGEVVNTNMLPDRFEGKTLAVPPFRNASSDQENACICTNMQEEIINRLRKIQSILIRPVIEPSEDSHADMFTIAKELDVDYLLDGTLLQFGDTIRLWIILTDVKRNVQVWEEAYNIPFETEAIYDFHAGIAGQVVASMDQVITAEEQRRMTDRYEP